MAVTTRLELATPGVTSRCSDQTELSHLVPVAAAAGFLVMALASAAGGGWPPCLPTGTAPATGQIRLSPPFGEDHLCPRIRGAPAESHARQEHGALPSKLVRPGGWPPGIDPGATPGTVLIPPQADSD